MDFDLGTTTTFFGILGVGDVASRFMFVVFVWQMNCRNTHVLPCVDIFPCFFCHVFPSTPFSTNEKTTTTNDAGDTSLDLSRGYSSRGVLKQQLQTAVESTGSFEMLWSAVGELDMSGSSTGLTKKLRWPNWGSLKNCGNYKGRMKEERFYCLCKIVWYLHYVY